MNIDDKKATIERLQEVLRETNDQIRSTQHDIDRSQRKLSELIEKYDQNKAILIARLREELRNLGELDEES